MSSVFLRINTGKYAELATPIANPVPVGGSLTFKGIQGSRNNSIQPFLDVYTGTRKDFISLNQDGKLSVRVNSIIKLGTLIVAEDDLFTLIITRDASGYTFKLNGEDQFTISTSVDMSELVGVCHAAFEWEGSFKTLVLNDGSADTLSLNTDTSVHTAGTPVVTDSISGNNLTGVGMLTGALGSGSSAWVAVADSAVEVLVQPVSVTSSVLGRPWSLSSTAVGADSSEWYKDGVATGNTSDSISGVGAYAENGQYYNQYTNSLGDVVTDTVTIQVVAPFAELVSATDIHLGETFTVTTNGVGDLTGSLITATLGGVVLTGQANVTTNTVDFNAPTSGLDLDVSSHELRLVVDTFHSSLQVAFLPPTGYTYLTLTGINEHSWLSDAVYTGNAGGGANNISIGDQIVYQDKTKEGQTLVNMSSVGIINLPNAASENISGDQTLDWFYLEAQEGFSASNTQTLTLLIPKPELEISPQKTSVEARAVVPYLLMTDGLIVTPTPTAVVCSAISAHLALTDGLVITPTYTASSTSAVAPYLVLRAQRVELAPATTSTLVGNNATVYLYAGKAPEAVEESTRPTPTLIAMAIITLN